MKRNRQETAKLTWEETARQMASRDEDWALWEQTDSDGIDALPWGEKAGTASNRSSRSGPVSRNRS